MRIKLGSAEPPVIALVAKEHTTVGFEARLLSNRGRHTRRERICVPEASELARVQTVGILGAHAISTSRADVRPRNVHARREHGRLDARLRGLRQ